MKFDTPATHQSDRPAEGRRPARRPHRRPAQDHRHARPTPTSGTTWLPNQAYGYVVGVGDCEGPHRVDGPAAARGGARRARHRHRRERRPARQGQLQHRDAAGRPRDPALPPGDRGRRGGNVRAGARGGPSRPRRLRAAPKARSIWRRRRTPRKPAKQLSAAPRETARRRLRRRVRRGARAARCHLHDARRSARDDGAACDDRRMGRRPADGLDLQPDDRLGPRPTWRRRSASRRKMSV